MGYTETNEVNAENTADKCIHMYALTKGAKQRFRERKI